MRKFLTALLGAFCCVQMTTATAFAERVESGPTQQQISTYVTEHPLHMTEKQSYIQTPTKEHVGKSKNEAALNTWNFVRFIANMPAVEERQLFSDFVQQFLYDKASVRKSSIANVLNSGKIMVAEDFSNSAQAIMYGQMNDVTYRTQLLNPTVANVGIAARLKQVATVVETNELQMPANAKILWPAEQMPIQYMTERTPFSVTLGTDYKVEAPIVTMQNVRTKQKATYAPTVEKGADYTTLSWQPDAFQYDEDEPLAISIDGVTNGDEESPFSYRIQFFDVAMYVNEYEFPRNISIVEGEKFTLADYKRYDYSLLGTTQLALSVDSKKTDVAFEKSGLNTWQAVNNGQAIVTIGKGKEQMKVQMTVLKNPAWVDSIKAPAKVTLKKGKSYALKASVLPTTAKNKKLSYTASNPRIISVNKSGKIKAKSKGTTMVTINAAQNKQKKVLVIVE